MMRHEQELRLERLDMNSEGGGLWLRTDDISVSPLRACGPAL